MANAQDPQKTPTPASGPLETLQPSPATADADPEKTLTPALDRKRLRSPAENEAKRHCEADAFDLSDDQCYLEWAPRLTSGRQEALWLRYRICTSDARDCIKYLQLDLFPAADELQSELPWQAPGFFDSEEYLEIEPLLCPPGRWTFGKLVFCKDKDDDGEPFIDAYIFEVPSVVRSFPHLDHEAVWKEKPSFDFPDLLRPYKTYARPINQKASIVTHPDYGNKKLVAKILPTPFCVPTRMETEMAAYRACDGLGIAPEFIGNITENGRVVGFLIEYIKGARKPQRRDMEACRNALRGFHKLTGWHRAGQESCRDNFLIKDGRVYLVDLAGALTPRRVQKFPNEWFVRALGTGLDAFWNCTSSVG